MNPSSDLVELSELAAVCARDLRDPIAQAESMALETLEEGSSLLFCGNGGSAADAQHLAAEYVIRFKRTRGPLRALALTTDTSVLTAGANDFSFADVFARLRQEVDLALVIPTETVARAQELHLAIGHAICERVDRHFAEGSGGSS